MIILSMPGTETKAKVVGSFLDTTTVNTVSAETLPVPEDQIGKDAVLYINPQTGQLFYEYEDRELTEREQLDQTTQNQALIILALVEGGLM